MHSGDTPLPASQFAEQAMPLLERIFSAMLDPRGELCIVACTEHLDDLRAVASSLAALPAPDDTIAGAFRSLAAGFAPDLPRAEFIGAAGTAVEQLYEWLHAARTGAEPRDLPHDALAALLALEPGSADSDASNETHADTDNTTIAEQVAAQDFADIEPVFDGAAPIQPDLDDEAIKQPPHDEAADAPIAAGDPATAGPHPGLDLESSAFATAEPAAENDHHEASIASAGLSPDAHTDDASPSAAVEPAHEWPTEPLDTSMQPEETWESVARHDQGDAACEIVTDADDAEPALEHEPLAEPSDEIPSAAHAEDSAADEPPANDANETPSIAYDLDLLDALERLDDGAIAGSASSAWEDLGGPSATIEAFDAAEAAEAADVTPPANDAEPDAFEHAAIHESSEELASEPEPHDPFATMPDPNKPLDPTGGAGDPWATMPDPNKPLDPTGGAGDPWATMPDPNKPLDPTGGAGDPWATMPDPNAPLDPTGTPALLTPEQMAELMAQESGGEEDTWGTTPLMLSPEKGELLQFMVSDVRDALTRLEESIAEIRDVTMRGECGKNIATIAADMAKVSEFFDFRSLRRLLDILQQVGRRLGDVPDAFVSELEIRLRAIATLITQHCAALEVAMEQQWPLSTLARRVDLLLSGRPLHRELIGWHNGDVDRLLELDRVVEGIDPVPMPESDEGDSMAAMADAAAASRPAEGEGGEQSQPTIRVPKDRVEHLLDVVRQLVLSKNQMSRLARALRSPQDREAQIENLNARTEQLDRLIGELQLTLMDTRMQTIDKLFDRYDRVVRDVARLNDKEVTMSAVGGGTKVDKFVLEALSDPLGRLLRFLASHDIETSSQRLAAGKPSTGRVRVSAENQGSHVRICLRSDGQGLDRDDVAARARSFGLLAGQEGDAQDDRLLGLLLDPRFEGSPLAGLRSAFDALHGEVIITSAVGNGLTIDITLPVTSAVIPAMLVGLGDEVYAIPLQSVLEIVKAGEEIRHEVNGCECVRIRESVLAAVDLAQLLRNRSAHPGGKLAVVVTVGEDRVALLVDRILGHQEIVIEPLDAGSDEAAGPFSGATIRDDGGVSLILDLSRLVRAAKAELAGLRRHLDAEPTLAGSAS